MAAAAKGGSESVGGRGRNTLLPLSRGMRCFGSHFSSGLIRVGDVSVCERGDGIHRGKC